VQLLQASQAPRQSDESESSDGLPSFQQARQDVQRPEPQQGQVRERASQHPASRRPSPEQQAPRHQQQASRPQLQAQQAPPRQASPLASSRPWLSPPLPLPQLLRQPPGRENACAPVPRASDRSSSSASFFP